MRDALQSSWQSQPTGASPLQLPSMFPEVHLDPNWLVVAASAAANELFRGLLQPDTPLSEILHSSEKTGILATGATKGILAALSQNERYLFDTRDGRTFLVSPAIDSCGNVALSLADVSHVMQTALSRQKDALTGLPNRLDLIRHIEEHAKSSADDWRAALLYLDLDKFKLVNDTLGQTTGDALLKLVTDRLSRILGPDDLLARTGGDEFAILQRNMDQPHAAETLALRVIDLVGRTYLIQGQSVQIGVSVGISLLGPDSGSPEELIKNADLALTKAKAAGRSTFRFFTESMDVEMQRRRGLEIDLQRALVLEQFHLVYQPQFQIHNKRLVGFEALLRWSTPERGYVSPGEFIPIAEETGLIDRLGEWVLKQACQDAATWPRPLSVSVNVSPVQFRNARLMGAIISALRTTGLEPDRLDVEITEGALMEDTDANIAILHQLKALGVRISMDDFGTGYSSLSYLQKFPFDKIKIDQSFIRSVETSVHSASIVRAVTALGDSLGIETIAEGVETESQLAQITLDGCKQVQGYLTGRPVPPNEAAALANNHSETVDV